LITSVDWVARCLVTDAVGTLKATKRRACLLFVDFARSDDQGFSVIKPHKAELHDSQC